MDTIALHGIIRKHIQDCYRELNHIVCPWDGSEAKALDKMLKANPSWTELQWLTMCSNYFLSEGVNGARPRQWLPNISMYAGGPLDRFGKLQRVTRCELEAAIGNRRNFEKKQDEGPKCMCYISKRTNKLMVCPWCDRKQGEREAL